MQLAYELLPFMAGQDENLLTAISILRHRSRVYLLDKFHQEIKGSPEPAAANRRPPPTKRINRSRMSDHTV
jgi:hypothetical protein